MKSSATLKASNSITTQLTKRVLNLPTNWRRIEFQTFTCLKSISREEQEFTTHFYTEFSDSRSYFILF